METELDVTHALVDVAQPPPEGARRQAAEADVGAEDSGAGSQGIRRRLGFLKTANPALEFIRENTYL